MRISKTIDIDEQTKITINELTAEEIQEIMDGLGDNKVDIIDMLFPDSIIPSSAISKSLSKTGDEIKKYAPSELESIIEAVEEVNPTFASLIQGLAQVGRNYLETKSETHAAD